MSKLRPSSFHNPMTTGSLLIALDRLKVGLSTDGRTLFVDPPHPTTLTPGLMVEITRHKPVIIRALVEAGPGQEIHLDHLMRALEGESHGSRRNSVFSPR